MSYYFVGVSGGYIQETKELSWKADPSDIPGHEEWFEVDSLDNVKPCDVCVEGTIYHRPRFGAEFDFEKRIWDANLDAIKQEKIASIDARTSELIREGFTFKNARFSMSDAAQRNWGMLGTGLALGMMQFPYSISTVDEDAYVLQSETDLRMFLAAYMIYQSDPTQPLSVGRILKEQVTVAKTIEEVEAIVDNRE